MHETKMATTATSLNISPANADRDKNSRHRITSPDLRSMMERAHGVGSPEESSGSSGEDAPPPTSKPAGEALKLHFKAKKTSGGDESTPVRRISLVSLGQGRTTVSEQAVLLPVLDIRDYELDESLTCCYTYYNNP